MNSAVLDGGAVHKALPPARPLALPNPLDSGLICLAMLARFLSIAVDPDQIAREMRESGKSFGTSEILHAKLSLSWLDARAPMRVPRF